MDALFATAPFLVDDLYVFLLKVVAGPLLTNKLKWPLPRCGDSKVKNTSHDRAYCRPHLRDGLPKLLQLLIGQCTLTWL
ncbi:hypothetical protein D3C81_2106280 [compost metagenome]